MPKISVVIPTYNRPEGLKRVLTSISAQSFKEFEVIVVEDGSKVGEAIVNDFSKQIPTIKYLWQENAGPAKARNTGIKATKADIVAFTDDDMKLPEDWLAILYQGFQDYPQVAGVGGYMRAPDVVLEKNIFAQYEWYVSHDYYHADEEKKVGGFENPAGGTNNIAFKKSVLDEVNGFDEHFPVPAGEDADLKKRITDKGYQLLYVPLKADHYQPYGFKRFLRQSFVRGVGTYYFVNKHEKPLSKGVIYSRFLVLPKQLLVDLVSSKTRRFAFIKLLENINVARGLLSAANKGGVK